MVHNGKHKHHQSQKEAKVVCSARNVTIIIFFYEKGFLYQPTVYQIYTITAMYYQEVLQKMRAQLKKKKKCGLKKVEEILLHHYYAYLHVAHTKAVFLEKRCI